MMSIIRNIKAAFEVAAVKADTGEKAQGSLEWLLLIGVVVVALISAVKLGFPGTLVSTVITNMSDAITALF